MKRKSTTAFKRLAAKGIPVFDHGDYGEFVISAEDRDHEGLLAADYYGEEITEHVDATGEIINGFGIREDVHVILRKAGLFAEWVNPGMLGVYEN